MTDAPSGSTAPAKKATGKSKAAVDAGADGKKRFEVKKVRASPLPDCCAIYVRAAL